VELQARYNDIRKQGLGLIAVSYDAPATLQAFAKSRNITFPLVSDQGSAIIKRYGILNAQQDPKSRSYGIPHPGTFIVDRNGIVTSRFFEDAYQERYTAAAILAAQPGGTGNTVASTTSNRQLEVTTAISSASVAPGDRFSVTAIVNPQPTMHVYAPGKHSYQVVKLTIDPQPWLRVHEITYPPSEIYHFKPLDERVEVYSKSFRLTRDVTMLATPEVQKMLAATPNVTLTGAFEYQACDDKVCYNPARVPLSFTLTVRPLDRRPPGE